MMNRLLVIPKRTSRSPADAWVGEPSLFHENDRIYLVEISCIFTWDKDRCEELKYRWQPYAKRVAIGGPAYDDPGGEFEPGRYVKKGIVHTSRGCPRRCPWCYVWRREGGIRELKIKEGHIVEDSNILACSRKHIEAVAEMLRGQHRIEFKGGLDARLLKSWHVDMFRGLRIKELWFAYDQKAHGAASLAAIRRCRKAGFGLDHIHCFVMIGKDETQEEAVDRLERVYEAGGLPFAMLYDKVADRAAWKDVVRTWSRPALYKRMISERQNH
jgi:hypothetical protein